MAAPPQVLPHSLTQILREDISFNSIEDCEEPAMFAFLWDQDAVTQFRLHAQQSRGENIALYSNASFTRSVVQFIASRVTGNQSVYGDVGFTSKMSFDGMLAIYEISAFGVDPWVRKLRACQVGGSTRPLARLMTASKSESGYNIVFPRAHHPYVMGGKVFWAAPPGE